MDRRYQHVLALCALLTGVILKGLTLRKFMSVCVCMFYVCKVIGFVDWLDRGLIYMWDEFRNVYLLMSLTVLRWPCVVDRTLKPNYYYSLFLSSIHVCTLSLFLSSIHVCTLFLSSIHVCTHSLSLVHTWVHSLFLIHICVFSLSLSLIHTCVHSLFLSSTHVCTLSHPYMCALSLIHTCVHSLIHTCVHSLLSIHVCTLSLSRTDWLNTPPKLSVHVYFKCMHTFTGSFTGTCSHLYTCSNNSHTQHLPTCANVHKHTHTQNNTAHAKWLYLQFS